MRALNDMEVWKRKKCLLNGKDNINDTDYLLLIIWPK